MSILSGFFKTKKYRKTSSGYKLQSEWTSSQTVQMDDGNTAQTNLGDIKGITDSLTATSSNVAISAKAGNNLQTQINELNTGISELADNVYFGTHVIPVVTNSTILDVLSALQVNEIKTYRFSQLPKDYPPALLAIGNTAIPLMIARKIGVDISYITIISSNASGGTPKVITGYVNAGAFYWGDVL